MRFKKPLHHKKKGFRVLGQEWAFLLRTYTVTYCMSTNWSACVDHSKFANLRLANSDCNCAWNVCIGGTFEKVGRNGIREYKSSAGKFYGAFFTLGER